MSEYPENFIDALKFKAALGWANEHEALLQEIDSLTDMLSRIMSEAIELDHPLGENYPKSYCLDMYPDADIQEWWKRHKEQDEKK